MSVLELVARGAITQRFLAISLRLRPEGRGYEQAVAARELAEAGYLRPPVRFARLLHRRCPAVFTARGWHAFNDAKLREGQALPQREG
jgi:hypothetical protein